MIIDAHVHLGYDVCFDMDNTEKFITDSCLEYGIGGAIVQPCIPRPYIEDYKEIHDRIYKLTQECKDVKFWGMSSMNPHFRLNDYAEETERCVKELGFVGVKLSPIGHAINPACKDGLACCDVARSLGVPVMIHTGNGGSFADPIKVAKVAEEFPDLTVVMAHAGASGASTGCAVDVAKRFDNVFVEPSWVDIAAFMGMVETLGCSKLMFSSDIPENIPVELATFRRAIKSEADLEQVFCKTAQEVFKLK